MNYCPNCGTQFEGNACPNCGAPAQAQEQYQQQYQQPQYQQPYQQPQYQQPYQQPYQQQPQYGGQTAVATPGKGLGIAAMVLAIIGLVVSLGFFGSVTEAIENRDILELDGMLVVEPDALTDEDICSAINTSAIVYAIFSVLALVFAFVSRSKGYRKQATAGMIIAFIAIAVAAITIFYTIGELG